VRCAAEGPGALRAIMAGHSHSSTRKHPVNSLLQAYERTGVSERFVGAAQTDSKGVAGLDRLRFARKPTADAQAALQAMVSGWFCV